MDGRMDEQSRAIDKLFNAWFDAGVFPHSKYAQNYANGASAGFHAGYRAALAARDAEVGRLEIERGVFAAWATQEVIDAKDAMHILKVDEDQFRELVNTSAKRLVELMGELAAALADHTP